MKKLIIILLITFSLASCNKSKENVAEIINPINNNAEAPQNKKDSFIKIEFEEGPLKGKHTFPIHPSEITSGIGITTNDEGFIDINGGTLFNSNEDRLSIFNRLIAKDLIKGSNAPYAKDCGGMIFHDRDNSKPDYRKIYVNFTACTPTEITTLTPWKDNPPYHQRAVAGNFKDTVSLEISTDEGETKMITSAVTVSFSLIQKELKK